MNNDVQTMGRLQNACFKSKFIPSAKCYKRDKGTRSNNEMNHHIWMNIYAQVTFVNMSTYSGIYLYIYVCKYMEIANL